MEDAIKVITCKVWEDTFQGAEVFCIMSPKLKTLRISLGARGIDSLEKEDADSWAKLHFQAMNAISERKQWEAVKMKALRRLARIRGKYWVYELPEYEGYIKKLHGRYPLGSAVAWLEVTIPEMQLLLKISQL